MGEHVGQGRMILVQSRFRAAATPRKPVIPVRSYAKPCTLPRGLACEKGLRHSLARGFGSLGAEGLTRKGHNNVDR